MMEKTSLHFKNFIPPILLRILFKNIMKDIFNGSFESWKDALSRCSGYDDEHILSKVFDSTLRVVRGEAAYERDSVLFDVKEYSWPLLSGLMWSAAQNGGVLNVVDFGGALGSSYFQNKPFLNSLKKIKWNVIEQESYVNVGNEYVKNDDLHFYKSLKECLNDNNPNIIILSGVLQYLENPEDLINEVGLTNIKCLVIDRTPVFNKQKSIITIQRPKKIYPGSSYPMRVFSKDNLISVIDGVWDIYSTFKSIDGDVFINNDFVQFIGLVALKRN